MAYATTSSKDWSDSKYNDPHRGLKEEIAAEARRTEMTTTFKSDWVELRRVHNNCRNSGVPVLDWNVFAEAVSDLMMVHTEYQAVRARVWAAQDAAVPNTRADRHIAFLADQPDHVVELFELDSDKFQCVFAALHKSDLKFQLAYGRSKRNPLAAMKKRAAAIRKATLALEEGIRRYEDRDVAARRTALTHPTDGASDREPVANKENL